MLVDSSFATHRAREQVRTGLSSQIPVHNNGA